MNIRFLHCHTVFSSLPQNGLNTGISILNKRTGIPVKINRFFRIEHHGLFRIHFQYKIFQCSQSHFPVYLFGLRFGIPLQFSQFLGSFPGGTNHFLHQVVSIHHRPFPGFHLPFRQFHHPVRQMVDFMGPVKS